MRRAPGQSRSWLGTHRRTARNPRRKPREPRDPLAHPRTVQSGMRPARRPAPRVSPARRGGLLWVGSGHSLRAGERTLAVARTTGLSERSVARQSRRSLSVDSGVRAHGVDHQSIERGRFLERKKMAGALEPEQLLVRRLDGVEVVGADGGGATGEFLGGSRWSARYVRSGAVERIGDPVEGRSWGSPFRFAAAGAPPPGYVFAADQCGGRRNGRRICGAPEGTLPWFPTPLTC